MGNGVRELHVTPFLINGIHRSMSFSCNYEVLTTNENTMSHQRFDGFYISKRQLMVEQMFSIYPHCRGLTAFTEVDIDLEKYPLRIVQVCGFNNHVS